MRSVAGRSIQKAILERDDTLTQCWVNVGPASQTLVQHESGIGSQSRVFLLFFFESCFYLQSDNGHWHQDRLLFCDFMPGWRRRFQIRMYISSIDVVHTNRLSDRIKAFPYRESTTKHRCLLGKILTVRCKYDVVIQHFKDVLSYMIVTNKYCLSKNECLIFV